MRAATRRSFAIGLGASALVPMSGLNAAALDGPNQVVTQDVLVADPIGGWEVSTRLFTPLLPRRGKLGFIIFSHGANSSGTLYDHLLKPLAASGFVIAAPTHIDSESNPNRANSTPKMTFEARMRDIDVLTKRRLSIAVTARVSLSQFDGDAQIIAGHSYGALLALYLVGAGVVPIGSPVGSLPVSVRNLGYRGAIAVSPPGAISGFLIAEQFDTISAPVLITTGEKDVLPGFVPDWRSRLSAFERSPTSPSYAAILPDVDHYFGGAIGRMTAQGPPQSASLATTAHLCGLFANAFGKPDRAALRQLNRLTTRPELTNPNLELRRRN